MTRRTTGRTSTGRTSTGRTLTTRQRVVPLVAALAFLGALAFALIPYKVLGIECRGALLGGKPAKRAATSFLATREGPVCHDKARSRLATSGLVAVVSIALGVSGALSPPARPYGLTVDRRPPGPEPEPDPPPAPAPAPPPGAGEEPPAAERPPP
jgi:hypothetical protein